GSRSSDTSATPTSGGLAAVTTEAEIPELAPPPPPPPPRPKTPEEIERHWYENVYQGDRMKQLTVRSVLMGMMLGGIMACSNVYVSLKTGWSLGVAITSCILAYSIFAALSRVMPRWFGD